MKTTLKSAALAITLGAAMIASAAPADAQRWRGRGDGGGRAAAGVAGLAVGAGLVAAAHADRDQWYRDHSVDPGYDDSFYRNRGYYPPDGFYASRYQDYDGCAVQNRYDSYTGKPVQLRSCN